jgi:hypothetical protein
LFSARLWGRVGGMKGSRFVCGLLICLVVRGRAGAEPTAAATTGFEKYVRGVEARLAEEHRAVGGFFGLTASSADEEARLRRGEVVVERMTPVGGRELAGALLHDWRGTAFAPGATAKDFERVLRDFRGYPERFAPEVLAAKVESEHGDQMVAWMRVRQKHVLTVVMDTTYDVRFGRLDERDGFSASRSLHIYEIAAAGTARERTLGPEEEHGFLWRLNTYWTYEERDGGLYIQVESVSLSRAIPIGLGWAVRPFVESVTRESLEFTLRSACAAVRK